MGPTRRRRPAARIAPILACAAACLPAGCESLRPGRPRPAAAEAPASPGPGDVSAEERAARGGIFRPTRRPGALSDEGAEIERSLGVGR